MIFGIYDNIFDDKFLFELTDICNYSIPNKPGNVANRKTFPYGTVGSHNLMGVTLFNKISKYRIMSICPDELMRAFEHIANNIIKKEFNLISIDSNMQTMGMDGTPHRDDGDTIMLFPNYTWDPKWGGEFQELNEMGDVLETVTYVPGRVIYFQGTALHRGLAPTVPYVYRHSIAYRVK